MNSLLFDDFIYIYIYRLRLHNTSFSIKNGILKLESQKLTNIKLNV